MIRRSRTVYLAFAGGMVVLGLVSRGFRPALPSVIAAYGGDTLWAAMVYLIAATLWNRSRPHQLALGAFAFAAAIEVSQLYQTGWISSLRATRLGGLVLGHGFLWTDLVCYALGVALGFGIDRCYQKMEARWRISDAKPLS